MSTIPAYQNLQSLTEQGVKDLGNLLSAIPRRSLPDVPHQALGAAIANGHLKHIPWSKGVVRNNYCS